MLQLTSRATSGTTSSISVGADGCSVAPTARAGSATAAAETFAVEEGPIVMRSFPIVGHDLTIYLDFASG